MFRVLPLVGLVCLLFAPAVRAADEVELRWQLKKGQILEYRLKHKEVRTTEVADAKFETTTDVTYEWQLTVKDVDAANGATIELKLNALRVEATGKEFAFSYDSSRSNEAEGDYNKKLKNFYDQLRFTTYRLQVKPDGKITEVYGFDKLLAETTPGTQVAEFHGYWLHDGTLGWFLQAVLGTLPEKKAARDARWKLTAGAELKGVGGATGQLELSLDKPVKVGDKPCEQIKVGGTHAVKVDMPFANSKLHGQLETSKLSGTVRFDPKAGVVETSDLTMNYGGELKFGLGDQPLKMKVTLHNEVNLERKP